MIATSTARRGTRRCLTLRSDRGAWTSRRMYNRERFRPRYDGRLGEPMLLLGANG